MLIITITFTLNYNFGKKSTKYKETARGLVC